jgi:tetratricopeptide (TPR) repeat protein
MVEDVISALTQGVNVRVLGATATANLGRSGIADLAALGRQLGVRYLLEGNVRRVGANLRVTTQLLEAETGTAIWTAKFDRPLSELAELQEALVTDIAASLDTQVYALEMERALKKPSDITAWEAVARAWSAYRKLDATAQASGIEEAKRAVAIAPDYAPGHAILAVSLALDDTFLVNIDDTAEVQRIRDLAERALSLAPDDVSVLGWAGLALCYIGYPDEGVRFVERAVRSAPGSGMLHYFHGVAGVMLNRPDEALSFLNTAARLMPGWHVMWALNAYQYMAYRELGRLSEANAAIDESLSLLPSYAMLYVHKAYLCIQLGQDTLARRHIEMARRLGWELLEAERTWRRDALSSPQRDADIATVRALYAAAEAMD